MCGAILRKLLFEFEQSIVVGIEGLDQWFTSNVLQAIQKYSAENQNGFLSHSVFDIYIQL